MLSAVTPETGVSWCLIVAANCCCFTPMNINEKTANVFNGEY